MAFSNFDVQMMDAAIALALQGKGHVSPNPLVGCIITQSRQIVAQGFHARFGCKHAEIVALNQAGEKAKGGDLYVNLEPCSHWGKTPPCVDTIIAKGLKKVFIATPDTNPKTAGKGIQKLKDAGIEVSVGLQAAKARKINRGFLKVFATGLPYLCCKTAMSLDGKIALSNGESQWITSLSARTDGHRLRADHHLVLTSAETVCADNPELTVRLVDLPSPPRAILDHRGKVVQKNLKIFSSASPTLHLQAKDLVLEANGRANLKLLLRQLAQKGYQQILLEAGGNLVGAFAEEGLIDQYVLYIAPTILGDSAQGMAAFDTDELKNKLKLKIVETQMLGVDLKIVATQTLNS